MGESGSVTLNGGESSSLSFAYNPSYGGNSQAYTVSSSAGTVTVTVYAVVRPDDHVDWLLTGKLATAAPMPQPRSPPVARSSGATAMRSVTRSAGPGVWESNSVTLSGGQSSSLSFAYNPAYGGNSQTYSVSSSVGSVTVTVYAVLPTITLTGADGAGDGSTSATATFTATGGSSGATATVNYIDDHDGLDGSTSFPLAPSP